MDKIVKLENQIKETQEASVPVNENEENVDKKFYKEINQKIF